MSSMWAGGAAPQWPAAQETVNSPFGPGTHAVQPGVPEYAALRVAQRPVRYRTRIRWENIVPALAIIAIAGVGITYAGPLRSMAFGTRAANPSGSSPVASTPKVTPVAPKPRSAVLPLAPATPRDVTRALTVATRQLEAGQFDAALSTLDPIAAKADRFPKILALQARIQKQAANWQGLMAQLQSQVQGARFEDALATVKQLAVIAPLTDQVKALQAQATAGMQAANAKPIAKKPVAKKPAAPSHPRAHPGTPAHQATPPPLAKLPPGATKPPTGTVGAPSAPPAMPKTAPGAGGGGMAPMPGMPGM